MKIYIPIIILVSCLVYQTSAQTSDRHYSQFYMNEVAINPANTGVFAGNVRGVINYKDQWRALGSPYKTFTLGVDKAFFKAKDANLGVGLLMNRDKAGDLNFGNTGADLLLSGIVKVAEGIKLSAGLSAGYNQMGLEKDNMIWGSQVGNKGIDPNPDPETDEVGTSSSFLDIGAGFRFSWASTQSRMSANDAIVINGGFAAYHLNKPTVTFYGGSDQIMPKYVINAQALIPFTGTNLGLMPALIMSYQNKGREIMAGALVKYKLKEGSKYTGFEKESSISVGGFYRFGDSVAINGLMEFGDFGIGLGYDVNLSGLTVATKSRGGLELSIRYTLPEAATYGKSRI